MMYARCPDGSRREAEPGLAASCPACSGPVRPKCGAIVVWHWAHHARAECDPWAEPDSAWHRGWHEVVPPERREVVMGPHRADVVTASGGVVELQHSGISPVVIAEREEFYGERMAWLFDARKAFREGRLHMERPRRIRAEIGSPSLLPDDARERIDRALYSRRKPGSDGDLEPRPAAPAQKAGPGGAFRWANGRRSLTACRRTMLFDTGGAVLHVLEYAGGAGRGYLLTRESVEAWMRDRARWEMARQPGQ